MHYVDQTTLEPAKVWSGEGNGNPLQYSYLENPMDGEARWATVHGVAKSQTRLSNFTHFKVWSDIGIFPVEH